MADAGSTTGKGKGKGKGDSDASAPKYEVTLRVYDIR